MAAHVNRAALERNITRREVEAMRTAGVEGRPPERVKQPKPSLIDNLPTRLPFSTSSGVDRRALRQGIAERENQARREMGEEEPSGCCATLCPARWFV